MGKGYMDIWRGDRSRKGHEGGGNVEMEGFNGKMGRCMAGQKDVGMKEWNSYTSDGCIQLH